MPLAIGGSSAVKAAGPVALGATATVVWAALDPSNIDTALTTVGIITVAVFTYLGDRREKRSDRKRAADAEAKAAQRAQVAENTHNIDALLAVVDQLQEERAAWVAERESWMDRVAVLESRVERAAKAVTDAQRDMARMETAHQTRIAALQVGVIKLTGQLEALGVTPEWEPDDLS